MSREKGYFSILRSSFMTKRVVSLVGIMIVASIAISGASLAESESRDPPPVVDIALLNLSLIHI